MIKKNGGVIKFCEQKKKNTSLSYHLHQTCYLPLLTADKRTHWTYKESTMRNSSLSALSPANTNAFIFGRQSKSVEYITLIVSLLTIAVGMVGNLLLSLTIATSASLRTPMNTFVLSIGLVDLLTSVFLLPLRVFVERRMFSNQEIDPAIYGLELFVRTFTDITRLFLMMSLSVERYQSIANPLSVSKVQAKRRALIMSGMTWTVSIILSGVSIRYFCDTVLHQPCLDSINGTTTNWGNLEVFVEMPLTILSILAIAICYSLIVLILKQQRKKMAGHLKPKMNQVVPEENTRMSQLQLKNDNTRMSQLQLKTESKVEISETKDKTNIKVISTQDAPQQNPIVAAGNDNCVAKNESCSDILQIDHTAGKSNGDPRLYISIKQLDKVIADGIEKSNMDVSHNVYSNSASLGINSNMSNQSGCHEDSENINYESECSSTEKARKMSTSSRSPLIINSCETATERNNRLYEDTKVNPECRLANITNTAAVHTITHSTSTGENNQERLSPQDIEQRVNGGAYSLPNFGITESTTELTHTISSLPQKEQSDHTYIQRPRTVQLDLTTDNGYKHAITYDQPSTSIPSSDRYKEIQNSLGRGKHRHSFPSRAAASFAKASPRLRNRHAQRLQSVIAFLRASDVPQAENTISNSTPLYNSSDATDFKVIPGSEDNDPNPSQEPVFSKSQNPHTDQLIQLTNDNPTTSSAYDLNSQYQSSASDLTQESSSRNTTLQTSVESDLDNANERLLQNSNNNSRSTTLSCEPSSDYHCSDVAATHNYNPSITENQASDQQQNSSQLATNCADSPSHQQLTEQIEIKDAISMPEMSIVDFTVQHTPNSLESNPLTGLDYQKTILTDKSNDKEQVKNISPRVTNVDKHVEVVEMDGTVHLQVFNSQNSAPIEGAVCLMNPRNREQGKRRVELKAALKVGLIVCCFACLWMPLPLSVCILRGTSCLTESMRVDMLAVFSSLATSTCAVDPILYGLLNPQIRSALQASMYKIKRKMVYYCKR